MAAKNLLLTGASGYIGGTILASLLAEKDSWFKTFNISALVRTKEQADKIQSLGATPIMFNGLDDTEQIVDISKSYDVIIQTAAGWHSASAIAFIEGLAARKTAQATSAVHYLHISGSSNVSDKPHTENYVETRTFSDEEDIYSYEKYRESFEGHPQRATDIAVIERGEQLGVHTYVFMAPTMFGLGTGPFNRFSIQLPYMIAAALKSGSCIVAKDGETVWSHVHVEDVADLFLTVLRNIEQGQEIPHGRKGIYFAESGEHTHLEMSQRLAKAGKELGVLATDKVASVSLEEAANQWMFGLVGGAEASFAANSRTKAVLARKLGWSPRREGEWTETFRIELEEYQKNPPVESAFVKLIKKMTSGASSAFNTASSQ